jgi:hypothetical protein
MFCIANLRNSPALPSPSFFFLCLVTLLDPRRQEQSRLSSNFEPVH